MKMSGYQYRWLAGGYDLKIGDFVEVASMVVTWCIVAFLCALEHMNTWLLHTSMSICANLEI